MSEPSNEVVWDWEHQGRHRVLSDGTGQRRHSTGRWVWAETNHYTEQIARLAARVQEQDQRIEELEQERGRLQSEIENLERGLASIANEQPY